MYVSVCVVSVYLSVCLSLGVGVRRRIEKARAVKIMCINSNVCFHTHNH